MVAGSLAIYRVMPGKAEEFRTLIGEYRAYVDSFGAQSSLRQALFAAERVGTISMPSMYPDAAARAEAMDKILADLENNPGIGPMTSADPPATLEARTLLQSIDPAAVIPSPPNILMSSVYAATASTRGAAVAALSAATERHQGLGVSAMAWTFESGPNRGSFLYSVGFESMTAMHEFGERNRALAAPPPVFQALQAGVMTPAGSQVSMLLDT